MAHYHTTAQTSVFMIIIMVMNTVEGANSLQQVKQLQKLLKPSLLHGIHIDSLAVVKKFIPPTCLYTCGFMPGTKLLLFALIFQMGLQ